MSAPDKQDRSAWYQHLPAIQKIYDDHAGEDRVPVLAAVKNDPELTKLFGVDFSNKAEVEKFKSWVSRCRFSGKIKQGAAASAAGPSLEELGGRATPRTKNWHANLGLLATIVREHSEGGKVRFKKLLRTNPDLMKPLGLADADKKHFGSFYAWVKRMWKIGALPKPGERAPRSLSVVDRIAVETRNKTPAPTGPDFFTSPVPSDGNVNFCPCCGTKLYIVKNALRLASQIERV
jgi:hypothetical protein